MFGASSRAGLVRPIPSSSSACREQVRRPISRYGVDAWKPCEAWLQPLRDALAAA